jgi:hypothetical protein
MFSTFLWNCPAARLTPSRSVSDRDASEITPAYGADEMVGLDHERGCQFVGADCRELGQRSHDAADASRSASSSRHKP